MYEVFCLNCGSLRFVDNEDLAKKLARLHNFKHHNNEYQFAQIYEHDCIEQTTTAEIQ